MKKSQWIQLALHFFLLLGTVSFNPALAINRVSVNSGNFNQATTWNPAGVPLATDQVIIQNGHVVNVDSNSESGQLTIAGGGKLTFAPSKKLTIHSHFLVYGMAEIVDGDIDFATIGASFIIGATGNVIWSPANNTVSGASLFLNGIEYFHSASTLNIKKWYNYSNVPLGSVVTGNFGNVILNTLTGGLLYEWNQDNEFETHVILGTLTIDQGWVVLDKSGTISNTIIGDIYLKNINSYFDIHSGNHTGSFNVTTNSITNIGGKFNGVYNGEGNIHLQVNGNFTNLGNTVLIYNTGIQGAVNGNASIEVTGKFSQSTGDFRGIFNLSSTTSGKTDLEFGEIKLTGGIFMGHYACHTAGNNSNIKVNGNLEVDFSSPNSKFRGNGLTTLSGIDNNMSMQLTIEGDLIIKGNAGAEFTSSGSTGPETTVIKGTSFFEGCASNFNFGNHATTLNFLEHVTINGGMVYFSRTNGSLTVMLQQSLHLQSGNLSLTGGTGNSNMIITGDYNQTGGSLFFHNNNATATPNIIYATVYGNFNNQSGNITFDNNSSSTAQHRISLNGELFNIGGSAGINSTVAATNPMYGIIYFDRIGEMQYTQNGTNSLFRQVKQVINTGCNLKIINGNMQAAESIQLITDMIHVSSDAILDLGEQQIYGNNLNQHSSIFIDEDARLRISGEQGLFNGAATASISAAGNMIYTLHDKSIIEYYGSKEQIVTGTGNGNATTTNQQYGILEINKIRNSASLNGNQVVARSGVNLNEGELNLNGFNIIINSGDPSAISASGGYIKSEGNSTGNNGMVKWKNISPGLHVIPFGLSAGMLLPFSFTPVTGLGNEFAVSTRNTGSDNRPLTNGVLHLKYNGTEAGNNKIIDRWFHVLAPGVKADISASYSGTENSTYPGLASQNFSFIQWNGINWKLIGGSGKGTTSETGTVTAGNVTSWGPLLMVSNIQLVPADLLIFNATLINKRVTISWTSVSSTTAEKYTVERSEDDFFFTDFLEKFALPASATPQSYSETDAEPLKGISYYRLKQHQPDGNLKYSQTVRIDNSQLQTKGIEIVSVNPNPFKAGFTANYAISEATTIEIKMTGSNGQIVYSTFIQNSEGQNSFEFNEGDQLNPGLYILTISDGRITKNYKLFHI